MGSGPEPGWGFGTKLAIGLGVLVVLLYLFGAKILP